MKKRKKTTAGAKSRDKARAQNTGKNKASSGSGSAPRTIIRSRAARTVLGRRLLSFTAKPACQSYPYMV